MVTLAGARLVWNSLDPCCYTEEFEFRSVESECLLGTLGVVGFP